MQIFEGTNQIQRLIISRHLNSTVSAEGASESTPVLARA